jgi:hypothetical protein
MKRRVKMMNEYVFRASDNKLLGRVISDEEFENLTADELREALVYTGFSAVIIRTRDGFRACDMRDASEVVTSEWGGSFHTIEATTKNEAIAKLREELESETA